MPSSFISLDCAVIPCRERVVFSRGFLLWGSAQAESFFCNTPMETLKDILPRAASLTHVQLAQNVFRSPLSPGPFACSSQCSLGMSQNGIVCGRMRRLPCALKSHMTPKTPI